MKVAFTSIFLHFLTMTIRNLKITYMACIVPLLALLRRAPHSFLLFDSAITLPF